MGRGLAPLRRGLGAALLGFALPAWSLNIMVTNDDSCNAEGINTLMDTLEAAGHQVTMYAPAGEQSGRGGAISTAIGNHYDVSNVGFHGPTGAANRYCIRIPSENPAEGAEEEIVISATPKDSALVGLALMADNPPDLVISGINDGQNIGFTATSSGTVGAAVAALGEGYPAIAVSRNRFSGEEGMSFADVANFVVDVVAELEASRTDSDALLPPLTGLNINNPAGIPRGVVHTELGSQSDINFGPGVNDDGSTSVNFEGLLTLEELVGDAALAGQLAANPDATLQDFADAGVDISDESSMSVAGYITITTLDGDLTGGLRKRELLQLKLRALSAGGE